ncbi:MAG: ferritin [candidate division WOR-3 bacterium]|uniref:Ferritin n=1 Tax=candidate division WOR-3 bacterium TaxID=2052148 RepID=A0A7C3EQE0_UNCW3|nr:ferritin [candidate division WOR-3 bacterium]
MIPKRIEDAFNEQIRHELESAYLYLAMAAYFDNGGFPGMGRWMRAQVQEELTHAMRFYKHIIERGGEVRLQPLNILAHKWDSPLKAFEAAYEHEKFITGKIHELVKLAQSEGDYASNSLLQWFVDEQVEEEESTLTVAQQLRLIGGDGRGLLMIDRELGQRTFVLPPELANLYAQGTGIAG